MARIIGFFCVILVLLALSIDLGLGQEESKEEGRREEEKKTAKDNGTKTNGDGDWKVANSTHSRELNKTGELKKKKVAEELKTITGDIRNSTDDKAKLAAMNKTEEVLGNFLANETDTDIVYNKVKNISIEVHQHEGVQSVDVIKTQNEEIHLTTGFNETENATDLFYEAETGGVSPIYKIFIMSTFSLLMSAILA